MVRAKVGDVPLGPSTLAGRALPVQRCPMHVLIPTIEGLAAEAVARELEGAGHTVHTCHAAGGTSDCAVLDDLTCPLETAPIDIAVEVGGRGAGTGDGALCALTRRVPLVLVDGGPDHPLMPWAADALSSSDVVADVGAVADMASSPLPAHTDVAAKAMLGELRRHGTEDARSVVEVRRRDGGLVVEVWRDASMTRTQAERMATHIAQAVRGYDSWARQLDVTVHEPRRDATAAS